MKRVLRFLFLWRHPCSPQIAFTVLLLFGAVISASAQIAVRGQVVDETGSGLPGASILIKGTTNGTTSDGSGNYSLQVPDENTVLVITYVGYEAQEVAVAGRSVINANLAPSTGTLEEVVVVGYGTQRAEAVTGSVASISGDDLREMPAVDFTRSLQGRLPGVDFQQNNTRPGSSLQIRIRGASSLSADNNPLVVLDGIPFVGSINEINTNDIKSFDVLKDASATAIYGSRGANGVILITTNRGQKGQAPKITYNGRYSVNKVFAKYPMMNGPQFVALRAASGRYSTGVDESDDVNTDWQDLFYRDGYQTSHDIGLSGGTDHGSYSFGLGFAQDQGVVPTNRFTRYTMRSSIDQEVGNRFRIGFTSNNNYNRQEGNQVGIGNVLSNSPIADPFNPDGTLKRTVKMPLDEAYVLTTDIVEDLSDVWLSENRGFASYNSMYGEVKLPGIEGLKYRLNMGLDFVQDNNGSYTAQGINSTNPLTESGASISNSHRYHWTVENLLTYDHTFAQKHSLNIVALYSAEQNTFFNSGTSAKGIPSEDFQFYSLGQSTGELTTSGGSYNQTGLNSYMARAMYEYNNRYFLSATFRADASSVLAPGHKWHTYPAVSAGWNIMEESFMQGVPIINRLKLRVGYGQTSNQAVGAYSTLGRLGTRDYNFGDADYATGYYVTTLPSPDLGWEYSTTSNLGLDFSILKNRLSGTVEYYVRNTNDILLNLGLPPTSGVSNLTANIGKTQNKGMEFSANGVIIDNVNGWTWEAGLNIYTNKNKIVELANGSTQDTGNGWFVGHNINAIYDYEYAGLWQADSPNRAIEEPGADVIGSIRVKYTGGFDGSGVALRAITSDDRQIRDIDANFQGGFNTRVAYKGFDFGVIGGFQSGGVLVSTLNGPNSYLNLLTARRNNINVDYWTPENIDAKYPNPAAHLDADNPKYLSTLAYFDGSYLKVRSMSLGYDFTRSLIKNSDVKLRMSFTVQNVFVLFSDFNKEMGLDPETNSNGNQNTAAGGYQSRILTVGFNVPSTRNYTLGVNLTF